MPSSRADRVDHDRVGRGRRGHVGGQEVEHDPELGRRLLAAHRLDRPTVGEHQVVGGTRRGRVVLDARRVHAGAVPEPRGAPRLVQRRPVLHPVGQCRVHLRGVVDEPVDDRAVAPAALVLQLLGEVPVVERGERRDAPLRGGRRRAGRRSPRPAGFSGPRPPGWIRGQAIEKRYACRPRSPIRATSSTVAVPVVHRHVAVAAVGDGAGPLAQGVPDRAPAAVLVDPALDLVRRGGGTPEEAGREVSHAELQGLVGPEHRSTRRVVPTRRSAAVGGTRCGWISPSGLRPAGRG